MELIYSRRPVPNKGDRTALNPVHFTAPDPKAKKVYVDGDEPRIKAAYEELNIPVKPLSELPVEAKKGV